jgi:acyl-CoA hydrolase
MSAKHPSDSLNIHTELIMPGHTNPLGNLMGGNLLSWMDVATGVSAMKHSGCISVTASVDNVSFKKPIKMGDVVVIKSFVTRAFNTSMEVFCEVKVQNIRSQEETLSHTAFFTFVALDQEGNRIEVPSIVPQTDFEKELYDAALRRRELRLYLAGKLSIDKAMSIQDLFIQK